MDAAIDFSDFSDMANVRVCLRKSAESILCSKKRDGVKEKYHAERKLCKLKNAVKNHRFSVHFLSLNL